MPQRTSYDQGTPSWVDLQTPDPDAAKTFYSALFGWTYDDQPIPEGGVYSMAMLGKDQVAAMAPQPPELAAAGAPAMWNTYLAVEDVDSAVAKVDGAGGKTLMPAMDVMDAGRMGFVADPGGAAVGLWQAKEHIGATLVNEPGTIVWNELVTEDPSAAEPFYREVVGLTTTTMEMGDQPYTLWVAGEAQVGGLMTPQMPGAPNHWHVYFQVEETDTAIDKAMEQGGRLVAGPFDTPVGRIATLADPQGGVFSVLQAPSDSTAGA
jgi:predicted enzyme related to lactoylglutathione lyase